MFPLAIFLFSLSILHTRVTSEATIVTSEATIVTSEANRATYEATTVTSKATTVTSEGNRVTSETTTVTSQSNGASYYKANRVTSELNDIQRTALLTFIYKVNNNSPLFHWNESKPACTWQGVTCNPDSTTVLYLQLPAMNLAGEIPPNTIGMLTSLRVLSLHSNQLNGTIPYDFSNLTFLTRLLLNNNSFSGQLPYINADYLTIFNVSYNQLNTSIPSSLSTFPESAFFKNVFVCGYPLASCESSYPTGVDMDRPAYGTEQDETTPNARRKIVGVSMGTVPLLMILLCSVGKKVYDHQIKRRRRPPPPPPPASSKADTSEKKNEVIKLVLIDGDCDFDSEDVLKASAEVLGEGSFGTSYKQVFMGKKTTKTVVVKRLKDVVVTENEFSEKMEVLGRMKNKNLVPLIGYYNYSKHEKWVVYDYMSAGSLSAHLHGSLAAHLHGCMSSLRKQLNWDHRMRIALSAAKGLAYLHEVEQVHGNIKSSNIFLQQETNNEASLSDYGLNTLFRKSSSLMNFQVIDYCAPEVLKTRKFTFKSDVYSFGVLLLELLTGKTPKQDSLGKEGVHFSKWVESILCEGPKDELFDVELTKDIHNVNKMVQLLQITKDCVSIVPNQRPTMPNVVSMMEGMFRITTLRDTVIGLKQRSMLHRVPSHSDKY